MNKIKDKIFLFLLIASLIIPACSNKTKSIKQSQINLVKGKILSAIERVNPNSVIDRNKISIQITDENSTSNSVDNKKEGFKINFENGRIKIFAKDFGGLLYASQEAAQTIIDSNGIPQNLKLNDFPRMKWRGISLQLMKLGEYNYAITPKEFPFFYNKKLWKKFLDFMEAQRFNYIILWNGHPFDYFVKFDKFKEAQSGMTNGQIQRNHDMLKWLIAEAEMRNVKIFFEFYNINTSVYYQKAHNLPRQVSKPTPELSAYTKYSISKFVNEFPEVGLFVTPGEGLLKKFSDTWINNVIFKAVKSTGNTPTIFMRAWTFDLEHARKILNNYPNLTFVRKFNVEMIADTLPDPENTEWAKLTDNFIVNIHLAANLEPFRWNPPFYIQSIVKNNIKAGANGIHLHPRKAWRWPYGCDTGKKEYQWSRDTLWYTAWSRYSWNPNRNKNNDKKYWINLLTAHYGNKKADVHFLNSFEKGADVLPGLQRLLWIGYDNHTIISAGATLLQLQNSKGIPFLSIKPTIRISDYIEALKKGKKIEGETPVEFIERKIIDGKASLEEAELAKNLSTLNNAEADKIVKDAKAELLVTKFYELKLKALVAKTLYDVSIKPARNKKLFLHYLLESVNDFKKLAALTKETYTSISDVPAKHPVKLKQTPYHWKYIVPVFEEEYEIYKNDINTPKSKDFYKPVQHGLAGIFYGDEDFRNANKPYPASQIDFKWDATKIDIGRHWSVKWFGFIKAPVTGKVKFITSADHPIELIINRKTVISTNENQKNADAEIHLVKNKMYKIEIEYNHKDGELGALKLMWKINDKNEEVIPREYFRHSFAQQRRVELLKILNKLNKKNK